ncbi:hypothetical protein [Maioricimonas rarisocia]|nr:hypothetical protein [Maioricimonas rarisocia]
MYCFTAWLPACVMTAILSLNGIATGDDAAPESLPTPPKKLFQGKVVLVTEALEERGIKHYPEMKDQVALETPDGELIPILSDWRGRAFYQDERLRNRKVELVGFRREGLPYLQILMVFTFNDEGERTYTDYWCDICSIPMYEIKPCECCQGPIRLRFQKQDLPDYLDDAPSAGDATESP